MGVRVTRYNDPKDPDSSRAFFTDWFEHDHSFVTGNGGQLDILDGNNQRVKAYGDGVWIDVEVV